MKFNNPFQGKIFKRILYAALIFFLLFISGCSYWKYYFTYSDGYRAGLLQKFSHKGAFFKTYEGEMILSSVQSNNNMAIASEKFMFSVTDDYIAQRLDTLQGQNVIVHYKQKNATLPWRGQTTYIVDSVKKTDSK